MKKADFLNVVNKTPIIVPVFVLTKNLYKDTEWNHLAKGEAVYGDYDNNLEKTLVSRRTGVEYSIEQIPPSYLKFVRYMDLRKSKRKS